MCRNAKRQKPARPWKGNNVQQQQQQQPVGSGFQQKRSLNSKSLLKQKNKQTRHKAAAFQVTRIYVSI